MSSRLSLDVDASARSVAVALLLSFGLWPELLLEIARLRVESILEAVTESVQDVGSRAQGR